MIKVLNRQCTACLHTSSTRRQNQTAPFFNAQCTMHNAQFFRLTAQRPSIHNDNTQFTMHN